MSLYRFVKSSSSSASDSRTDPHRRLFVQGTRENDDKDNVRDVRYDAPRLQAVHTQRHLSTDVYGSSEESSKRFRSAGTKYVTTRVVRKTTTLTRGEEKSSVSENQQQQQHVKPSSGGESSSTTLTKHHRSEANSSYRASKAKRAKISDIVVGEDTNVSAKDALLKWARRSTAKYPGVRVSDFTSSWKDGLAFNAIIHRNRPDLIDWRNIRKRVVRERLENAFYIAEKEYGVTRLLDPEDVDTHEIDEKSLITYISSLYDVFPEPPSSHPLYSSETQQKIADYRDVASSLHLWLRERTSYMSDRNFPSTLIEMKKIAQESSRFRTEEMPARHRDKQRLQHIYRDLQKYFETVGEVDIEPELHIDVVDRHWNRLIMSHQERDQLIHEEIKRLERLQRLAEKTHREIKLVDTRLEDLDSKIREETRRLERLHPLDAKHNVDILEQEVRVIEENIQTLFADAQTLRDGRYPQSSDLQKRIEKLYQRWQNLRSQLHTRLVTPLSTLQFPYAEEHTASRPRVLENNPYYKNLEDCVEWCAKKLKQIKETEFAADLPGVQAELNSHLREHNTIEQFHSRCEQCINAKSNFHGDELSLYTQQLNNLTKLYTELVSTSNKRLSDLETLQDFLQSASNHLIWLNEKEEIELTRDWSDRDLNPANIQQYYHSLMAELDKREIQFSAVQDRGESLLLQNHSASKTIESFMTSMSNKWSWILQLTLALETHLKHASFYQQFFVDMKEADVWLNKRDELLNTTYSQSDFTLDEGERLLKGMQELREELNQYGEVVESLADRAQNVVPLKQRRQPVTRPIPILAVCNYKRSGITIEKCDQWVLHDNSGRIKWRVSNGASGSDCNIPGAVFLIPPPDKEALEAIDRLKRQFERTIALWQRKQLRMRQNMIFATIKVVKSWDLAQFLAMGADQRNAIRKALNEDAAKLLEEGDPADPQLRRLRREMDEVNRLFDEFERKSREDEENKNATRILGEQITSLQSSFEEAEHTLSSRLSSPIPRDVDSLEHLVIQHRDFETRLKALTPDVEAVQETFKSISRKTPALQSKLERVLNQWNNLWNLSHLYVERMKCVEITLNGLTEVNHILSDFEIKLASYGEMPSEPEALKSVHKELLNLQSNVTKNQGNIDQVMEDGHNTRRLVEKSRHHFHSSVHHDLDRLDADLNKVTVRWNNICSQLVDRLKSCEVAYAQLEKFTNSYQHEARIIEDSYQKLNSLTPPVKSQVIETHEPTKTLYKNVMQRVPAIEQVNIDGGKFIREAKIYDLRLLHYCDWLIDEIHPSLEASVPIKKKMKLEHISGSGEAAVSHDLDVLNNRFGALASVLYDRLKQLMILYPEDKELKELVNEMEPKPLKTFRTEFSIYEQSDGSVSISTPKRLSNGVGVENEHHLKSSWDTVDTFTATKVNNFECEVTMGNGKSMNGGGHVDEVTQFSEIRSLRRINLIEDGMNADGLDILQMKGIVHPETNEILTIEEAIRLRILDVRTGKIAVSPNSKSVYISIEEAVQRKLVMPELAKKLLGPCGILQKDGKTPMSLLEAIQRELTDAERGPMERLKVNEAEVLNASATDAGCLVTEDGGRQITILNLPLALHDLLGLDLVDRKTGRILDRDTGEWCSLEEAIERRILDASVREIVDAAKDTKITVNEALASGLLQAGKYHHTLSNERITFYEAKRRRLIIRPMSLKDSVDLEVLTENGLFRSPIYRRDLSLAEALERAVLDLKGSKTILDTSTGSLLTLSEALQDGTITPVNLYFLDRSKNELLSIQQATEQGYLFSVAVRSIFDIATFRADTSDDFVSFNDALEAGVLKKCADEVRYYHSSGDLLPLSSAANEGYIKPDMLAILNRNIGIHRDSRELTLIEAAAFGHINSRTGLLVDFEKNVDLPFVEALKRKLINEQGVATLKSVLAISVSTQTITKTIVTYSTTVRFPPGDEQKSVNVDASESSSSSEVTQRLREEAAHQSGFSTPSSSKSPEVTRKGKRKFPIKEKIIKILQPLEMKDARTYERHKLISDVDVPPEGWDLEVAVIEKYIDPTNGMFTIPGTDRQVSFEECVKLEIINPKSAVVIEPHKGKKVSLKKALEKQILDCTGQYQTENEKLSLKEAIERSLIVFVTSNDKIKLQSAGEGRQLVNLEPVRIFPNVIFDPQTALVIFVDDNSSDDLCNAVSVGKIDPTEIKIKLPHSECSLQDAVQKEIIDLSGRTYVDEGGEKVSLGDAIKCGMVGVVGEPLVATKTAEDAAPETAKTGYLKDSLLDDTDDEYVGPSLAQLTRTRVTTEPKYMVSIGKAKSVHPNKDFGHPVLLRKIRKKKVKPKDAVSSGIIDKSTADMLESLKNAKDSFGKPLTLIEALDLTQANPNAKLIKDPQTRDMITIKEAVSRGIIEQSLNAVSVLVPIARSLSLPDLVKQGLIEDNKIIHPETGEDLSLREAIVCDIVDPRSKIKDPITGNVFTLVDAMNEGIIRPDLLIKVKNNELDVRVAMERGDIFVEEAEENMRLPPVAMTLEIAAAKGLYDSGKNLVRRPMNGEWIPLKQAVEEGLILPLSPDTRLQPAEAVCIPEDSISLEKLSPETVVVDKVNNAKYTLKEAQESGTIDVKTGKLNDRSGRRGETALTKAVELGLLAVVGAPVLAGKALADAFSRSKEKKSSTKSSQVASKRLAELADVRTNDPENRAVLGPTFESKTDFRNFIFNPFLFDVDELYVKDLTQTDSFVPLKNAIAFKIMDEDGCMVDPDTGKKFTFFECVNKGWITESRQSSAKNMALLNALNDGSVSRDGLHAVEEFSSTTFRSIKNTITNDPNSLVVRDSQTDKVHSLADAIGSGLIDPVADTLHTADGSVDLLTAFARGLLLPRRTPMSLVAAMEQGYYCKDDNKIMDDAIMGPVTLEESIRRRIIDPILTECKDVKQDEFLSLKRALEVGLVDNGQLIHTVSGETMSLGAAVEQNLIVNRAFSVTLIEAVEREFYDPEVSRVFDPCLGHFRSIRDAIDSRILDVSRIEVFDDTDESYVAFDVAAGKNIVDLDRGVLLKPAEMTLDCAVRQQFIREALPPPPPQSKAARKMKLSIPIDDTETAESASKESPILASYAELVFAKKKQQQPVSNVNYTLEDCIRQRFLDPETAVMRTLSHNKYANVQTLLKTGALKSNLKVKFMQSSNPSVTARKILSAKGALYSQSPTTFKDAVDGGLLNTKSCRFKETTSGLTMPLKDAVSTGFVESESALLKDGANKRLLSLAESFSKGVFDSEKNTIIDTQSSRLLCLAEALKTELIVTEKLSLFDTLEYGLYNAHSGLFVDPFYAAFERDKAAAASAKRKRDLTLEQCVREKIVDVDSIVVRDSEGDIWSYEEATEKLVLDPSLGKFYHSDSGKWIDLVEAKNRRCLLSPKARQAMEERYRLCDDTLTELLSWVGEIEKRVANQDVVQEDLNQLRNQINILKLLKEEIDSQARAVTNCLDQVRQVVATGSEYLTRDEVNSLEKKGKQLRGRYDRANERVDKLLRRILAARDELTKFRNDLTVFTSWMEKAQRTAEEKQRSVANLNRIDDSIESIRDFVSDVIAHQADLRFITMAAQKFVDESKEYLTCLNEFRTCLPARLPHVEPILAQDSVVRNTVTNVTSQYRDLLGRVNALSDKLSGLGSKQKEYRDALNSAKNWLRDMDSRTHKVLIESVAADSTALEDQLGRVRALNNELVSGSRLIDSTKQALDVLLRSVGDQLSSAEIANLKNPVADIEDKYRSLCEALAEKCQALDTALVQSQGVQDALDSLLVWLNGAENSLKNITRPASLHMERLDDQMREYRVLQADVDSHRASVDSVNLSAKDLINTASNSRLAKKIETKLRDMTTRYDKLMDKTVKRGDLLAQVHQSLSLFNEQASHLERLLGESLEIIPEASPNKIEDLIGQKEALKTTLDQVVTDGKTLINHKDVTDTANLRDKIKALDQLWKELSIALDEKHRNSKLRQEQLGAYEKLQDQVLLWLSNMESKINRLEPVAVEMETVKKQIEEIKPHIKEHRDYAMTIDKVNDLGNALDSLNRPETPPRRRNAGSPTKRTILTTTYSSGRRGSQDSLPSPSRGLGYVTQSPGGSSGFGSRRSSQDGFLLDDLSEVQQQLNEINNRYSLLNVRLMDRQSELESIKEELRKHLEYLRQLSQFLDKIQRLIPKETIPETKLEADKLMKNIKAIVEEIYEKQAVLESTKTGVKDLLRKKPTAYGADLLENELHDTVERWKSLHDACKDRIQILEDVKDFHDSHDNLVGWLNSKDRIMTVLGPISSDSRMVQSQVQQVQVLREEFRTQQPQLDHFVNLGENILTRIPDRGSADVQKISAKLSNVQKRWNDLLSRLDERAQSLGAAADSSREFDAGYMRLKDALQNISDQLDDIPLDKEPEEQLRKVQSLERQLEGQRPLLADLEAAGTHLCEVLSDPTSRAEIQGKLSAVNRQYNNLQKKLDHRNAEIEALLRDGRQFESTCAQSLGWLRNTLGSIPERLLISADREVLQQQLEHHEPIYKEVMNKEHEIIMLLNKGEDLLTRSSQQNRTDTRNLQKDLDKIQQQWDKLRKDAVDRQTRLQTCWEHCKKYYRALETFIPWLSQAENKLDSLKPDTYKRTDVEKQLRELSLFRNDVWKHSGEFENLRTLGETFVAACDVDKELVKQELAAVKARWDKLNNELLERTQWLEDTARRLTDFSESLRDLTHSVQRCEDKLASHDSLGGASRDPKILERIKNLREESVGLKKPLQSLRQTAKDLVVEAGELGVGNASHLLDDVDNVTERLNDLLAKLDDRCSQLQSASTALAQYNEKIRGLGANLSALDQELDSMKPIGRDSKTVRSQLDDIIKFIKKVVGISDDVQNAVEAGEHLVDAGFSADTSVTREQTEGLIRQLNRLDERARNRESDLEAMLEKLQEFTKNHTAVMDDIVQASEELFRLKPVGSEVEVIKSQQEEFQNFRKAMIEPLTLSVDNVNKTGQGLIQSAVGGVNTSGLEKDLEKMNDKWNSLKDKLNERDRKLDVGLLQSGKFQEALAGLAKWLTDTEDLIANQKPPSADYKVVKAQLQEQKFLNKMLLDRQNSMSSLFAMGNEVAAGADPNERKAIERQMQDLMQRFDNLTEGAAQRMVALEQAMVAAKEFQDKLVPLLEWLDGTEKKIKDMELIPTDEEKIQQRIKEHDTLHKDILRKKPAFTELTEVASHLMTLVGDDEAAGVADKLQDTADRYTALLDASDGLGQLLQASRAGLRHLVLTYQDLQAWMESMDNRLNYYKTMPVHTEKLLHHMEDLADVTEDISNRQSDIDSTVDSGLELMKHISNDEAIQLKDKLDSLQRRYHDLVSRGNDLLKSAQETLPLVQQFHNSHTKLVDWMMDAESQLQVAEPREEEIARLEMDILEFRPVLENINLIGPQLCQISPGEGAATIEGLVTRDNRRFDAIVEQIQRKAERIHLSKQRSLEVMGDIDELLDWFREVENQLRDAEPPSAEPDIIRLQLKEHKALNDDISSQKSRVRDVLSTAKKVLRESVHSDEFITIREKMEDLKEMMDVVSRLSSDRLGILEQAFALAEHFHSSHIDLSSWLDDMERQVAMLAMPALRPDLIAQQQDRNEMFVQSINEHKPLVEKLNKTGEALVRLVNPEEGAKVQDVLDSDNARYAALRLELRQRQQALEKALQETSKLSDKLEGMLRALQNTAEQVSGADPISAHPPRIRDQIDENQVLVEDLGKREEAFLAVKKAANDVINKAPNAADPAVKDMKCKLEKLNGLWNEVQKATSDRGRSLEDALALAEKFWDELHVIMTTLKDLQESLNNQEPPAVQPGPIQQQQVALQEIRAEIDQTKPEVEQCRVSGQQLMKICGEPDKPEVKKHIEDLDNAWDNITALFAKREENLINAMEKAMEFHETLQGILDFLEQAEKKFAKLGPLGSDIDAVKRQIQQLKQFKQEVDPHMVKVEALNRQAQELTERTSAEQAAALKEPLASVNRRWDDLLRGIVERQRQLENALLRLGQFQHALQELLTWIDATDHTLETELKPVAGDPQLLEVELAKLKVLVNDIQAHQSSVDTLNDAGRQIIESGKGTDEASTTQDKLSTLNRRWRDLLQKAADRQLELEDALRDAQRFAAEIQDLLSWLGEVDGIIAASKPVGGLPETASEQLERFMEVYNELEDNRPKVETVLAQGQEYLKKSQNVNANNLQHNLKTLKQRWDSVTARANDKKIKLEIALKEATEFHEALQAFVDWLTNAEKMLTNLKPVSRVLSTILSQIEEHKSFQKDVSSHREAMLHLDKKGTHLKYFSQKQDVILIKNLLISVQHRWERVVAKSAERTRALDHGYKEAREFHDAWSGLMNWLTETEKGLDELAVEASSIGNAPEKIKQRLVKHREFQRSLSGKQATYDATMRMGKALKEKAPKMDEPQIRQMMSELKEKWNAICAKSVDRQRKLEEALLYCGQFKDALEALLDWLKKAEKELVEDGPVHGDLDTVSALIDQHKSFEQEFYNRAAQLETVKQTASELIKKANATDAALLETQLSEVDNLWDKVKKLADHKSDKLLDALKDAEELHRSVHMLLEWLSDAEMKLRFAATLPEDDCETRGQLSEHEKFLVELVDKERDKDATISLAQRILEKAHPDAVPVIKHWITIIQSRWDEVSSWAKQREEKLKDHMKSLEDLDALLEELLAWLQRCENQILDAEAQPLPEEIEQIEKLIEEHTGLMEQMSERQQDVDTVCKTKPAPLVTEKRGVAGRKTNLKSSKDNLTQDKHGSRWNLKEKAENVPHIGPRFPPKGGKGTEPTFRNPRSKQLYDKWRNVWLLAWERQRRLQERLSYQKELEKVRNFSWDDWRKRFLKFINHKKSRLTDLFRKMDKNNDGLVPREDFIDGIMKTKFDTSKLEMNAVADMFDHDGAGLIDWKEFIAALRPDWEEKRPPSEAEKIHDEVKRLVMLCTCRQKFRVFQVGEGKYRFGDSQKLRLVRILRSTVMVRVGGGWVALDEFLVKNDPCRVEMLPLPNPFIPEEHEPWCPYSLIQMNAKGRTNIELREQFILADGVSQSMSAFKPKHNASDRQRLLASNTGPITKIRERTVRSQPLGKAYTRNVGTPDSLSDNETSPYPRTPARRATPTLIKGGSLPGSRGNSRPASRQGSKPPSRHGSNLSLDSTDDGTPSRIPRRSSTSKVGGSITPRKPAWNGSLSSNTRSPSGIASPVSDSRSGSAMHRASSIPTLSATNSSSRIPVYVGNSSTDTSQQLSISSSSSGRNSNLPTPSSSHIPLSIRLKTPSGSSTPAPSGSRLQRKSSTASESSRRNSKTPTPTDMRAPFRL